MVTAAPRLGHNPQQSLFRPEQLRVPADVVVPAVRQGRRRGPTPRGQVIEMTPQPFRRFVGKALEFPEFVPADAVQRVQRGMELRPDFMGPLRQRRLQYLLQSDLPPEDKARFVHKLGGQLANPQDSERKDAGCVLELDVFGALIENPYVRVVGMDQIIRMPDGKSRELDLVIEVAGRRIYLEVKPERDELLNIREFKRERRFSGWAASIGRYFRARGDCYMYVFPRAQAVRESMMHRVLSSSSIPYIGLDQIGDLTVLDWLQMHQGFQTKSIERRYYGLE